MKPTQVTGRVFGPHNRELIYGIGCSVRAFYAYARKNSLHVLPRVKQLPGKGLNGFAWTPGGGERPSVVLVWVKALRRRKETPILEYTKFLNTLVHEVTHAGQILLSAAGLPLGGGDEHKEPLACFIADTTERILWECER